MLRVGGWSSVYITWEGQGSCVPMRPKDGGSGGSKQIGCSHKQGLEVVRQSSTTSPPDIFMSEHPPEGACHSEDLPPLVLDMPHRPTP